MFHVELRQFPSLARAFNLSAEELDVRVLGPWLLGHSVELNERRFSPEKARLTIYEGQRLRPEEIGLGRGWANVTRTGEDVTARVLEAAQAARPPSQNDSLEPFKRVIVEHARTRTVAIYEVLACAHQRYPSWRASDRLALAERAVWELLHEQRVALMRAAEPVETQDWQSVLLAWETWTAQGLFSLRTRRPRSTAPARRRGRIDNDA